MLLLCSQNELESLPDELCNLVKLEVSGGVLVSWTWSGSVVIMHAVVRISYLYCSSQIPTLSNNLFMSIVSLAHSYICTWPVATICACHFMHDFLLWTYVRVYVGASLPTTPSIQTVTAVSPLSVVATVYVVCSVLCNCFFLSVVLEVLYCIINLMIATSNLSSERLSYY